MISFWLKEVNEKTDVSKIDLLLVGNKIDLEESREVSKDVAAKTASDIGIVYLQTSAKTFESTKIAFDELVTKIINKKNKKVENKKDGFTLQQKTSNKEKEDKCC